MNPRWALAYGRFGAGSFSTTHLTIYVVYFIEVALGIIILPG